MRYAIAFALIGGAVVGVWHFAGNQIKAIETIERLERERVIDDAGEGVTSYNWRDKLRDGD